MDRLNKAKWYQAGIERLQAKDSSGAISAFQQVLKEDPYCGDAYSGIGNAFLDLGELSGAKAAFSKAVEFKPTPSRYVLLGGVLKKLGEHKAALEAFQSALHLSPENEEALFNAADIVQEKHPEQAIEMLRKALQIAPDFVDCYIELGALLNRTGQFHAAEQLLRKGVEVDSSNLWMWIELGNSLWRMGETAVAEQMFVDLAERFPNAPEPLWTLGLYVEQTGRLREAEDFLERAVARGPTDESAKSALAGFVERRNSMRVS